MSSLDLWLLGVSILPLALYALVHVEKRLIAPFVLVLLIASARKFASATPVYLLALAALLNVVGTARLDITNRSSLLQHYEERRALASFIRKTGGNHARVVSFGDPYEASTWARLARARLVAIMDAPDAERWWQSGASRQAVDLELSRNAGTITISQMPTSAASLEGWSVVPGASRYLTRTTPSRLHTTR
jgi:hypothetical protein